MIRVLHLVASSRGGGATHLRDLALGLDPARFAVQVAMPEDGGHIGADSFAGHATVFHRADIATGFSLTAVRHVRHLAAGVDVLHVHGARAALFGRVAAASLGRYRPRVVYIVQGLSLPYYSFPRRLLLLTAERLLAPVTDAVIAVSYEERRAFLEMGTLPPERVNVVWNSVDVARFREADRQREHARIGLGLPADAVVVTTLCRLYKPRDFETLLGAFARVASHESRLVLLVVGDGPDRPRVEALRGSLGLADRVVLAGQRRDVPAVLAATDIFVLTTWGWEGLPLSILEAMAAARPVVATRAGGIPEAVADGETGLLVDRRDVLGLADALARLAADPRLRDRMGTAGRQRAETLFSPQVMIQRTSAVYERLVSSTDAESSPIREVL